jgi:hypothetical protein
MTSRPSISIWLRPGMIDRAVAEIDSTAELVAPGTWHLTCPQCGHREVHRTFLRLETPEPLLWCFWHPPISVDAALRAVFFDSDPTVLRGLIREWLTLCEDVERVSTWAMHAIPREVHR